MGEYQYYESQTAARWVKRAGNVGVALVLELRTFIRRLKEKGL
jgi:hypothetical protein